MLIFADQVPSGLGYVSNVREIYKLGMYALIRRVTSVGNCPPCSFLPTLLLVYYGMIFNIFSFLMLSLVDVSLFYLIGIISHLLFEYLYRYSVRVRSNQYTVIKYNYKYIIPCHHKNHQKKQIIYTIYAIFTFLLPTIVCVLL